MPTPFPPHVLARLQAAFVAVVLPRVLSYGRVSFRHIKCRDRRADAIQEMISVAWLWHLRLAEKGKDATCFPTVLACYAAHAVKSGCRLCGHDRANDVLSPVVQQQHRFAVGKIADVETLTDNPVREALHDKTKSLPDETVCCKLDFMAWLTNLAERDLSIVEDLMIGEPTFDVANKYGVSPGRILQKQTEYGRDWSAFCGERVPTSRSHRPGLA